MKNPLTATAKDYEESPYLSAKRAVNEQYGELIQAVHNWRLIAFGCVAVAVISVSGVVGMALQHKVVPYAVDFNKHSEVVRVTRADEMGKPDENQVRAALRQLIIGMRSVFWDQRANEKLIKEAYAMIAPESPAFNTLSAYHQENNPFVRSQKETVEIVVNSVMAKSDGTWQIEWTETTKQLSGRVINEKAWQGLFTVMIEPPKDDAQILVNPLGLYLTNFTLHPRLGI